MLIEEATIKFKRAFHAVLNPFFGVTEPTIQEINGRNVVTYPAMLVFDVHDLDIQSPTSPIIAFVRGHASDLGDIKCGGGYVSRAEVLKQVIVRVPDSVAPVDYEGRSLVPKYYADLLYGLVALCIKVGRAKLAEREVYLPEIDSVATEIPSAKEATVFGMLKANIEAFYRVERTLTSPP